MDAMSCPICRRAMVIIGTDKSIPIHYCEHTANTAISGKEATRSKRRTAKAAKSSITWGFPARRGQAVFVRRYTILLEIEDTLADLKARKALEMPGDKNSIDDAASYSYFNTGEFIRKTGRDKNSNFFYAAFQYTS